MRWLERTLREADRKVERTLEEVGDDFPHVSEGAVWMTSPSTGWQDTDADWTAGFWPGILWLLHGLTNRARYLQAAVRHTLLLEDRLDYDSHDLGFLYHPACVLGYEQTGDMGLRNWALRAANRLVEQFCPSVGLLALRGSGKLADYAAVDTMMNLPLLWWAYRETGKSHYFDVASKHARSTGERLIREDGSTYHLLHFDRGTGKVVWRGTGQGASDASCWSRGQAWALCGFGVAAQETGSGSFAALFHRLYGYVEARLPADLLPYWDYEPGEAESESEWRDSSAAAIMASALLRASRSGAVCARLSDLRASGLKILESLAKNCAANSGDPEPGLLRHGCFHAPCNRATDASLIWGDYFFLDALSRATQILR
ncbi:MAG: glycoside hydrolase family 88 protein [Gemmatimonadota bacterium]